MTDPRSSASSRLPLVALLAANDVSLTGNVVTPIAIPLFVSRTIGSASRNGLTRSVAALPLIIAGLPGGAVVNRVGFRRMSIVTILYSGVTTERAARLPASANALMVHTPRPARTAPREGNR